MLLPPPPDPVFLATYFVGNGESGAYLSYSRDGYNFQPLVEPNVALFKPQVAGKLVRDPCLLQGPDGRWHMVWTTGWGGRQIGYAHSRDLVTWSEQKAIAVMPDALNAWAPELVYNDSSKKFEIFWSSTVRGRFNETSHPKGDLAPDGTPYNHRFYSCQTTDFLSFSPTKLLWDPGFNCIDATMIKAGKEWLMFAKDETKAPTPAKFLFLARSKQPSGPFSITAKRITGSYWAEGPTAVQLNRTTRVYFDRYMDKRWGAVESTDLREWTDVSDKVSMVPGARHGTVLLVSATIVEQARGLLLQRASK